MVTQMYKIMTGLVRIDSEELFTPAPLIQTRGHSKKIFKSRAIKLSRTKSFSQRVVNDWNNLPAKVVDAPINPRFQKSTRQTLGI